MADVFISYKRSDRAWAERISEALSKAGISCWWDTSLVAGEHFNQAIDRELKDCRCVVVIWSKEAHESRWVQAEALQGFERGILVATRIEEVALGYPFSVVQTVDAERDGVGAIIEGVQVKLNIPTTPRVRTRRMSTVMRFSLGCIGLSALLGLGATLLGGDINDEGPSFYIMSVSWALGALAAITLVKAISRRGWVLSVVLGLLAGVGAGLIDLIPIDALVTDADTPWEYAPQTLSFMPMTVVLASLMALVARRT